MQWIKFDKDDRSTWPKDGVSLIASFDGIWREMKYIDERFLWVGVRWINPFVDTVYYAIPEMPPQPPKPTEDGADKSE